MAQKKETKPEEPQPPPTTMSREEAAEVFRQIRKRDEFHVKALDALNASIEADRELKAKQDQIAQIKREAEEAVKHHADMLYKMDIEQSAKISALQKNFDDKADDLMSELSRLENEKAKSRDEAGALARDIEALKKERFAAVDAIKQAKIEGDKELAAYKAESDKTKAELE